MSSFNDIKTFRTMLRVNKHRLDEELELQAELQERISSQVSRLNSRALELKKTLDSTFARVVADLKEDDAKMSNPIAEKEARRHRDYTSAWQAWLVANQEHEEWLGLYEAWKARGYQLNTLAKLYGDDYFAINTVHGEADGGRLREVLRTASNEKRQSREETKEEDSPRPRRRPLT